MKIITRLSRVLNIAAACAMAVMMLLTVSDVFLRYFFNRPIIGVTELTELLMVCVGFLGLAWCATKGQHLKVDLVMSRFPARVQTNVDSITLFAGLCVCVFITWQSFLESMTSLRFHSTSSLLKVPDYPFYFVLTLGFAILCLAIAIELIQNIAKGFKR